MPNHFVIRSEAHPRDVATTAIRAFQEAWQRVHMAVWDRCMQRVCHLGDDTEKIWRRQVESYWEIMWVADHDGETAGLLARRKHWRTHRLPNEPGDKCTVMPDYQELSGHIRARKGAGAQDAFWRAVRDDVGVLDLREDERLCAPALVKRLFAVCSRQATGGELERDTWPSTVYMGTVPWLHEVRERAASQASEYVKLLRTVAKPGTIRRHAPVAWLRDAEPADFFQLDANYYHRTSLALPRLCPLNDEAARPRLIELLDQVTKAAGFPPIYYALLLADGDQLGAVVAQAGANASAVSEALSIFGAQVKDIVSRHHGVTVYAGGDDVLAMLPVESALACADQLAIAYVNAFTEMRLRLASLSAAVLFAHVRVPIGGALEYARKLLDDVAKEANGRDSIVAAVLKPGGPHCQWVTSWTRTYSDGRAARAVAQLDSLTRAMTGVTERHFSASLLHHLHETLQILCDWRQSLCGWRRWVPGTTGPVPDGLDLHAFIRAELLDSWAERIDGDEEEMRPYLAELTNLVADLLPPSPKRPSEDAEPTQVDASRAGIDALLLARFIADGGREGDHA